MEQFSHITVDFWGTGPMVGIKVLMILLQSTYKQPVLSGRNETIHYSEGVELYTFTTVKL